MNSRGHPMSMKDNDSGIELSAGSAELVALSSSEANVTANSPTLYNP